MSDKFYKCCLFIMLKVLEENVLLKSENALCKNVFEQKLNES